MEISQSGFLLLFVRAALAGICLGCLYECLALLRQMLSPDVSAEKLCAGLPKGFWKRPFFARAPLLKPEKLGKVGRIFLQVFFAIADALFAFSFGMAAVLVAYAGNSGRMRGWILLGIAVGYILFRLTVSRVLNGLIQVLAWMFRLVLGMMKEGILFPIRKMQARIRKRKSNKKTLATHRQKTKQEPSPNLKRKKRRKQKDNEDRESTTNHGCRQQARERKKNA